MKKYNPTSPGRRQAEITDWKGTVSRSEPEKSLTTGVARPVGRNSFGRITTRHKGGGVKRLWRAVDFVYDKKDVPGRVHSIEYDPNRSGFIALVAYRDGEKRYIVVPQGVGIGREIVASAKAPIEPGNRMPLGKIPVGTSVYNIEVAAGKGGQIARSAGSSAMILAQEGRLTHVALPSKEVRMIRSENWASIGAVSNPEHGFRVIGGAGRNRRRGVRPTVRGTAMNPVDHPHGGGEGRTLAGRRRGPATPWGKPARGVKTRKKNKRSDRFILSRRKK